MRILAAAFVLSIGVINVCCADENSKPIIDVRLEGAYRQIDPSMGDEWAPTWGRDDILYTGFNDGDGFGGIAPASFAFGQLVGGDPNHLKGTTLNGMRDYREPELLEPQNARWQILGSYDVGGIRYRFIPCARSDMTGGSCIVTSADDGKTWNAGAGGRRPLFFRGNIGVASFISFRKDIELLLGGEGQYIYASSYVGVVNGNDGYILGRISREKFHEGNPTDWSFEQADGSWKGSLDGASAQANSLGIGPDGANWKTMNSYSVDGVLYAFVTRCYYPWLSGDPKHRHIFRDSSVIKSVDSGRTWMRPAKENYSAPMFPGTRFGAPYFVWYGKDGKASVDNADQYAYAVSNDGHFEGGDNYILGRVLRSKLPALSAADWSFYKSGSGVRDDSWVSSRDNASPILVNPEQSGMTGMTYIDGLHRYVMVVWHYAGAHVGFGSAVLERDLSTVLEFFESPKPWGPWTLVKSFEVGKLGWYAPIIGQRFQTKTDSSTVTGFMYAAGIASLPEGGVDWSLYKLNYLPVIFSTRSLDQTKMPLASMK